MTDKFGNITIQPGLTGELLETTVRHESVHSFLSPGAGRLQHLRANWLEAGYSRSHFLRYTEEALAETYATGSLWQEVAFPLQNPYGLSISRIAFEGGTYIGVVGGISYGAYRVGQQIWRPEEFP